MGLRVLCWLALLRRQLQRQRQARAAPARPQGSSSVLPVRADPSSFRLVRRFDGGNRQGRLVPRQGQGQEFCFEWLQVGHDRLGRLGLEEEQRRHDHHQQGRQTFTYGALPAPALRREQPGGGSSSGGRIRRLARITTRPSHERGGFRADGGDQKALCGSTGAR